MSFQGGFQDIFFPGVDREPCVATYRIAITADPTNPAATGPYAIIHLVQLDAGPSDAMDFLSALDVLLNKIVQSKLAGVRIDHLRFVVESYGACVEVPIDFSTEDFVHRGNPVVIKGTGKFTSVHIEARDILGGTTSLLAHFEKREPLAQFVSDALQ